MAGGLLLDFDGSVAPLPGVTGVPLTDWQERIRFGCTLRDLDALDARLESALQGEPTLAFTGSGDFHHVSYLLIRRHRRLGVPIRVVVLDNHPDNMRYPFGIHCGSWVRHVCALPFVATVQVVGITSGDVAAVNAWANYLGPLASGRLSYWCIGRHPRWLQRIGAKGCRSFDSATELVAAFGAAMAECRDPVYLSIDKDVLAAEVARTNWDQGVMRLDELVGIVGALRERVVAADVTGDVSSYRYRSHYKRLLSMLDRQRPVPTDRLAAWQAAHRGLNAELARLLLGS